jgi:hypothetical protein
MTDAEVLLSVATWLKWIRDDALDERPALPVETDELNGVIGRLEQIAYRLERQSPEA